MSGDMGADRPSEGTARRSGNKDRAADAARDNGSSGKDEPTTFIGDNISAVDKLITFSLNGAPPEAWDWIGRLPEDVLSGWLAVDRPDEDGEWEAWCPIHENPATSDPSARFNFEKSVWHCFAGCPDGELGELVWLLVQDGPVVIQGNGATGGWEASPGDLGRTRQRRRQPLPSVGVVVGCHDGLLSNSDRLTYLTDERGLTADTIERFKIGWHPDKEAYTIPMYDEHGELVNMKYYRPDGDPKMWGVTGHNEARLYPLPEFAGDERDEVVFCEGELDALVARQEGLNAVTVTGGARTAWQDEWSHHFKDKRVFLVTDSDNPGRLLAQKVRQALKGVARQVVFVPLPYEVKKKHGEDLSDYFVRDWHSADDLRELMTEAAENAPEERRQARPRLVDGWTFIQDDGADVPPMFGEDEEIVWAEGEGLMIVGPQGVGKTTIVQQLTLRMLGIGDERFLDMPVRQVDRVLYLAMDRPRQVARSFARMIGPEHEETLRERLIVWRGPLPFNLMDEPDKLADFCEEHDADVVVIDSLKDVAPGLADDRTGATVNRALQEVLARGIELISLHHQRKATSDNKKPNTLDDVYGSTWLTSGQGSVVLLWGKPGANTVELSHLKQPVAQVGPLQIVHDHPAGRSTLRNTTNELLAAFQAAGDRGMELDEAAEFLFGSGAADDRAHRERARRQLKSLEDDYLAYVPGKSGGAGGGGVPARWRLLDPAKDGA